MVFNLDADSNLINGRGRLQDNTAPLEIHRVSYGQEYLFRVINAGYDDNFEVGQLQYKQYFRLNVYE